MFMQGNIIFHDVKRKCVGDSCTVTSDFMAHNLACFDSFSRLTLDKQLADWVNPSRENNHLSVFFFGSLLSNICLYSSTVRKHDSKRSQPALVKNIPRCQGDGAVCLRPVKESDTHIEWHVYIVTVTTHTSPQLTLAALNHGARHYIFSGNKRELCGSVRSLMGK